MLQHSSFLSFSYVWRMWRHVFSLLWVNFMRGLLSELGFFLTFHLSWGCFCPWCVLQSYDTTCANSTHVNKQSSIWSLGPQRRSRGSEKTEGKAAYRGHVHGCACASALRTCHRLGTFVGIITDAALQPSLWWNKSWVFIFLCSLTPWIQGLYPIFWL